MATSGEIANATYDAANGAKKVIIVGGVPSYTIADGDNKTFSITNNDTTNNPVTAQINNTTTGRTLLLNTDGEAQSLYIDSEATDAHVIYVEGANTGKSLVYALASGANTAAFGSVARFQATNAGHTNPVIRTENSGTGDTLFLNTDGNARSLNIDSEATSAKVVTINNAGTGNGVEITQAGNGQALRIDNAGTQDAIVVSQTGVLASGQYGLWLTSSANQTATGAFLRVELGNASTVMDCLALSHSGAGAHINFAGDPSNSSPADGDFWFDGANFKARIGATTYNFDLTAA